MQRLALAVLLVFAASCSMPTRYDPPGPRAQDMKDRKTTFASSEPPAPKMEASRRVSEQDCEHPVVLDQGNLKCR